MSQIAQAVDVFTRQDVPTGPVRVYVRRGFIRRSEWVILGFLAYTVVLGALLPVAPPVRYLVTRLNLTILVAYGALIFVDRSKTVLAFSAARDVASLALIVLAYREMGWFAQPHLNHTLEASWVAWDRVLLRGGARAIIESLGPVIPSLLEICYALVYALAPFAIAMLYVYGRREKADQFLFVFAVGVLLCYAQFPFWPSDPPRVVFLGQDLPYQTVFRRFNLWMLGSYGIHTSVFPSAHVAGAFAAAFGALRALPERRWVGRLLLVIASLIAIGTVYGRYHYVPDAVVGLLVASMALAIDAGTREKRRFASPFVMRPKDRAREFCAISLRHSQLRLSPDKKTVGSSFVNS